MTAGRTSSLGPAILDSHSHAWRRWPYKPEVPDELERARLDQLVYEMDGNGVSEALIVCAAIEANADNIDYVAAARGAHQEHRGVRLRPEAAEDVFSRLLPGHGKVGTDRGR